MKLTTMSHTISNVEVEKMPKVPFSNDKIVSNSDKSVGRIKSNIDKTRKIYNTLP